MTATFYLAFAITLFCATTLLLSLLFGEQAHVDRRAREAITRTDSPARQMNGKKRVGPAFQRLVRDIRARARLTDNARLRERFQQAGWRGSGSAEFYFAAQVLGPIAAIAIGSFIPSYTFFWVSTLAGVTYLAPDLWLERAIKARRARIQRSIPDAVDLLVICVDAGLGLDQAMLRVGQELNISHPDITEEFQQINREQRAGKQRMEAWRSMADRTRVPDIAAFTGMLVQTEKFGTPVARALNVFADGLRQKQRQRAEERAAKTTVKMIFPLVLFIFPSMFIVLLAPAVLSITRGLTVLGH